MSKITPEEYKTIDASASLITKEQFGITKQVNKHFILHPQHDSAVYMIGFGNGPKNETNPKGFYAYWVWYHEHTPYGGLLNCELKDKFDSIDYYMSCMENAEATINSILNEKNESPIRK